MKPDHRDGPTQAQIEAVRGAVARGWCHDKNQHKEMDSDLAEAITQEVLGLTAAAEVGERLDNAALVDHGYRLGYREAVAATIERCAQVAENTPCLGYGKEPGEVIAADIRKLKDEA